MKEKDIVRDELIGLKMKVAGSKNRYAKGIEGKVIDETRNTLVVLTNDGSRKTLLKDQGVFQFSINNKIIEVDGKLLVGRPEDRIKKGRA